MKKKIAFIGVGNMAHAIINGILNNSKDFTKDSIILFDKNPSQLDDLGFLTSANDAVQAVKDADFVVFAIKPQNFPDVLSELKNSGIDTHGKVFITIAAGISCEYICSYLPNAAVVRAMPNTPMLIGQGVCSVCKNEYVSDDDFKTAFALFSALGVAFELTEDKMNAIISLTSSSPAYIFLFIKALMDGAVKQGLEFEDEKELRRIACSTVIGSAMLLMESEKSPEQLIKDVTSPGGTTAEAMKVFYGAEIENTVYEAMDACTKRAFELAKK